MTLTERFWTKVQKSDGCWEWLAHTDTCGYGRFWFLGRYVPAHRYSWEIANNEMVPANTMVCHSCDNPKCVRPDHLFLGTHADNMRDASKKGRLSTGTRWREGQLVAAFHGELNGFAKLSADKVRAIRERYVTETAKQIASDMGISPYTVYDIVRGQTWTHVK